MTADDSIEVPMTRGQLRRWLSTLRDGNLALLDEAMQAALDGGSRPDPDVLGDPEGAEAAQLAPKSDTAREQQ